MRNFVIIIICILVGFSVGWFAHAYVGSSSPKETIEETKTVITKPLEKYTIESLREAEWKSGTFRIEKELGDEKEYKSYLFSYSFYPEFNNEQKITTGQINMPKDAVSAPIILMFRGYVDQTLYSTGTGTRPSASYFAKNGYITIAPDFLGYAGSSKESGNIFETRFQTYVTAISLLKTLENISSKPDALKVDHTIKNSHLITNLLITNNFFLWAHSNGGQIALTTLEVTNGRYPTTLWAPVTKSFPYSVLYYTDESEDGGKFIRRELAKFEDVYDVDKYSLTNYVDQIQAPIQIHQGANDDAVPIEWTNEFVGRMRKLEKDITYNVYPNADHNLRPDWDTVVERDVEFFRKLQKSE